MSVHRITLENPVFDMEGENNAYLIDRDAIALVDVGVATDATREQLERGLATHGLGPADVDHLFLTHWHPDHAGLAGAIQAAGGAQVHVHRADAPVVERSEAAFGDLEGARKRTFRAWGLPDEVRHRIDSRLGSDRGPRGYGEGDPPTVTPVADGDTVSLGSIELEAVHTPGHTAGETCYVLDRGGRTDVFTGDALLPDYTANVGGADPRTEGALAAHLESLSTLTNPRFDHGWPGHGEPMSAPAERARAVLGHHHDRAASLLGLLSEPTTVWEAARSLFGDLAEVHLMLGLGETHAHLEYLRDVGLVERPEDRYVATAGPEALDGAFPGVEQ